MFLFPLTKCNVVVPWRPDNLSGAEFVEAIKYVSSENLFGARCWTAIIGNACFVSQAISFDLSRLDRRYFLGSMVFLVFGGRENHRITYYTKI